jgi:hypothetical protein
MNGWSNYETWAMALWIDNEETTYRYWRAAARELIQGPAMKKRERLYVLAGRLKDEFEDERPELEGVWGDLLGAAMSEVNWHEIAGVILDDVL